MNSSFRVKTLFAGALCAVAVVSLAIDVCRAAEKQKLSATREQVSAACQANDGVEWGTGASSGRYGCMTDNAWVECDANGTCEGGRAGATADRRTVRDGGNELLQAME
ncbi:MAG: hypothetical protein ACKVOI_07065 [Dongiaceae bacterium]